MRVQNRPYSVLNVFDNLHASIGKSAVQQALDNLSNIDGPLIMKEYGAQKFYYCKQVMNFGDCSESAVLELENEVKTMRERVVDLSRKSAETLSRCPISDNDLQAALQKAKSSVHGIKHNIEGIRKLAKDSLCEEDLVEITKQFGGVQAECERRKRLCMRMLDELAIMMSTSRKSLISDLAIDV